MKRNDLINRVIEKKSIVKKYKKKQDAVSVFSDDNEKKKIGETVIRDSPSAK